MDPWLYREIYCMPAKEGDLLDIADSILPNDPRQEEEEHMARLDERSEAAQEKWFQYATREFQPSRELVLITKDKKRKKQKKRKSLWRFL